MRRYLFGLAVSAVLGLAADARAQFRGFGGGPPDPNQIWVFTAGGDVPSIDLNQRTDIRERLQRRGAVIPANGILTKEAFVADFQQRIAQGGGMGGPPGGGAPPAGGPGGFTPGAMTDDQIKGFMQRYDKNGDGRITLDEASDKMRPDFAKHDKNGDGAVDLPEYKLYIEERFGQRNRDGNSGGPPGAPGFTPPQQPQYGSSSSSDRDRSRDDRTDRKPQEEEAVVRPTVFRFGKLPKELPSWFEKLDTDADGQLGLYEWRTASKATADFVEMDQNGDGYLTAEEWLRFTKMAIEAKPSADSLAVSAGGSSDRSSRSRDEKPSSKDEKDKSKEDRRSRGGNPFTGGR
jgi:hypothetical protein